MIKQLLALGVIVTGLIILLVLLILLGVNKKEETSVNIMEVDEIIEMGISGVNPITPAGYVVADKIFNISDNSSLPYVPAK